MAYEGKAELIAEATEFVRFLQGQTIRGIHGQSTHFPGPVLTDAIRLEQKLKDAAVEPETIGRFKTAVRVWSRVEQRYNDGGM